MEPTKPSELSVTQWLRGCVTRGHFDEPPHRNPFHRDYWSDFTHYHGNMAHLLRRCWDSMPRLDDDPLAWNPILCVEQAYEDYERRLLRGEITFDETENAKRDLRRNVFQRKLLAILQPAEYQVFQLTVPAEVASRIEDTMKDEPFRQAPVLTPREARRRGETRTPREKPDVGSHPLTFVIAGSSGSILQKIGDDSVSDDVISKRKRESIVCDELFGQKRSRLLSSS